MKKDQVLVTLDDREIRQQLTAAEAQLKQATAEYERAKQLFEKQATTEQALTAANPCIPRRARRWSRSRSC